MSGEAVTCGSVVVELRGFEPLTPCMPCHPHHSTQPAAALLSTASVVPGEVAGQGAAVRREVACGMAADNLLTGRKASAGTSISRSRPVVVRGHRPRDAKDYEG